MLFNGRRYDNGVWQSLPLLVSSIGNPETGHNPPPPMGHNPPPMGHNPPNGPQKPQKLKVLKTIDFKDFLEDKSSKIVFLP